eukprot:1901003-Rhodomonas_salina.2
MHRASLLPTFPRSVLLPLPRRTLRSVVARINCRLIPSFVLRYTMSMMTQVMAIGPAPVQVLARLPLSCFVLSSCSVPSTCRYLVPSNAVQCLRERGRMREEGATERVAVAVRRSEIDVQTETAIETVTLEASTATLRAKAAETNARHVLTRAREPSRQEASSCCLT